MIDESSRAHKKRSNKESKSSSHKKKRRKSSSSHNNVSDKKGKRIKKEEEVIENNVEPISLSGFDKDEVETVTVTVRKFSENHDPIVVSFPSGTPAALVGGGGGRSSSSQQNETNSKDGNKSVSFAQDDKNVQNGTVPPKFKWFKLKKSSNRGKVIKGEDATCAYTAANGGRSDSMDSRLTKFYIGIYDKESKKLILQPSAEKGTVFPLHQEVKAYDSSPMMASGATSGMTVGERKRFLVESFGSSKKKKAVKSQQANIVNISNVVGSGSVMMNAMDKQSNISQSNKKAMEATRRGEEPDVVEKSFEEARRNFLPPFDEGAQTAFDVFDAQEIAGEDAWNQLSRITDSCVLKSTEDETWQEKLTRRGYWSKSALNILNTVTGNAKKSNKLKYQIKSILLLRYLISFHNRCFKLFLGGTEEQIAKFVGIPEVVCSRFLSLFAIPTSERGKNGYAITKQLKDKRTIHLLILYVLSHGKAMKVGSINSLCQDIKLEVTEAARLLVQAGFKCKKSAANGMISTSLSVPLTFPKVKILKRAK